MQGIGDRKGLFGRILVAPFHIGIRQNDYGVLIDAKFRQNTRESLAAY
jgi:hypothetical protein